jgi:hypothetical protein
MFAVVVGRKLDRHNDTQFLMIAAVGHRFCLSNDLLWGEVER